MFYGKVEEGKVYNIGHGQIATANKKFTSIDNDYRIIFNANSIIEDVKMEGEEGGEVAELAKI